ncbi:MAG: UDP-glucose 4-epimerase GalE [Actinobacteria bacterium]|nr:UDP-glucose 4-epimerase GalE [Actinomycetota bacterium]MCO5301118.1 UDP-glucose 4-epimerase GalE [Candidatus Nanopelagicales bacterium]MCB9427976.1 UDP-glucose 4-epimerase GalE [Actinomycetota bacterium]HPE12578.1 UDP-glucose 4-epimerase GalE [Actinomycetota bacterium]HPJ18675.1 UDP-glucose 4-epimerase GalE [Actinomycetota bacterium]
MTTWMLTGGAGYIGAHVLRALQASGREVVVLDDLSTGVAAKVPDGVPLLRANVGDRMTVGAALRDFDVTGVVHLAAKKAVGESVEQPEFYYRENVDGMLSLLEAMADAGTSALVYSSSAAVYGNPSEEFVSENAPLIPESPYGQTKVIGEWMTRNSAVNRDLSWTALRYFNVAGAASPELGDTSVFNLIPMVFRALAEDRRPQVFGDDYPTPDGSCIRDYIHVADLADAHVAAAAACERPGVGEAYNVGRGQGVSVFEVMTVISEVVGFDVNAEVGARRAGDPAQLVACAEKINNDLGWSAKYDLREMVTSAWAAWNQPERNP